MSIVLNDTLDTLTVERWIEKSGNNDRIEQLVKSRQPLYKNQTIHFDGDNDELEGGIGNPFNTNECAVYIVASTDVTSGVVVFNTFFADGDIEGSLNYLAIGVENGRPTCWYGDGSTHEKLQSDIAQDNSSLSIYAFRADGAERRFTKGASLVDVSERDLSAVVDTLKLGGHGNGENSKFQLRSYISYGVHKNETEHEQILDHLNSRYLDDVSAPTATFPDIAVEGKTGSSFSVSWRRATDDVTPQVQLRYTAYYSDNDNISTVTEAEQNGEIVRTGTDIGSASVSEISYGDYYINVVVEDDGGNKSAYNRRRVNISETDDVGGDPGDVSAFVTVGDNSNFLLNGSDFKFSGTNAYYLPQYETGRHDPNVVDNFFEAADDAGVGVIRTWGFYDGEKQHDNDITMQVEPGEYVEESFRALDRVIAKAKDRGIKVLLSFTNWQSELGGIEVYNEWAGESDPGTHKMEKFMNGSQQQKWYKDYITMLLNRTNTETGIAYKDEPAIFAWEIGNEMKNRGTGTNQENAEALRDWYQEIAQFIKGIDSNHMVTTGEEGFEINGTRDNSPWQVDQYSNTYVLRAAEGTSFELNTAIPEIDFARAHWYPYNYGWNRSYDSDIQTAQVAYLQDHNNIANSEGKPFCICEFGNTTYGDQRQIDMMNDLWSTVQSEDIEGDLMWMFAADGVKCWEYGGSLCYPGGREDSELYNDWIAHIDVMNGQEDTTPPAVSDGLIEFANLNNESFTAQFTEATDDSPTLTYYLYTSLSDNISTVADAENNGTLQASDSNVSELEASGLSMNTTYYVNIVVADVAGNKSVYNSNSVTTNNDTTAPTTSGTLSASSVDYNSFNVNFDKSTDDNTSQTDLVYELYISTSDNINSVSGAQDNGTLKDTGTDVSTLIAGSLNEQTEYFYNVLVKDQAGNTAHYGSESVTTAQMSADSPANEWDNSGITTNSSNQVTSWVDNIGGAEFVENTTGPEWDSTEQRVEAVGNNDKLYCDNGINFMSDNFQMSYVVDLGIIQDDFKVLLNAAQDYPSSDNDGGFEINSNTERRDPLVPTLQIEVNGTNIGNNIEHNEKLSVVTVRVYDGLAEAIIETVDGERFEQSESGVTTSVACTRMGFNGFVNDDDDSSPGQQQYAGTEGNNVYAIRIWDDARDNATRDSRIADMIADYM